MSQKDRKEKQAKNHISINFPFVAPIAAVLKHVAQHCHGPQNIDLPTEKLRMENITLTFNCGFGHLHKYVFVPRDMTTASFVGNFIPLAEGERKKMLAPVLVGPTGQPLVRDSDDTTPEP